MASQLFRSTVISDDLWALLEPILPVDGGRPGRPWNDHRLTLEAIYWRFRTGTSWRQVPEEFGPWQTVWERHRRWSADGTFERVIAVVKASTGDEIGPGAQASIETPQRVP